jgi:hypothetical protein
VAANESPAPPAAVHPASALLTSGLDQVARDVRVQSALRVDLAKQLAAKEIGQAADADPEVARQLVLAKNALAAADTAAAAWQHDLAAASAWWTACLADLASRNPEANGQA